MSLPTSKLPIYAQRAILNQWARHTVLVQQLAPSVPRELLDAHLAALAPPPPPASTAPAAKTRKRKSTGK